MINKDQGKPEDPSEAAQSQLNNKYTVKHLIKFLIALILNLSVIIFVVKGSNAVGIYWFQAFKLDPSLMSFVIMIFATIGTIFVFMSIFNDSINKIEKWLLKS